MDSRTGTISSLLAMREQGNNTFTPFSGEPEVHIWTQTLPIREDQLQTAAAIDSDAMTSEEHERMVRISTTSRLQAHCWMISRIFLRRVLAQYMQLQARDIRFEYGTSGKPYLGEVRNSAFRIRMGYVYWRLHPLTTSLAWMWNGYVHYCERKPSSNVS